MDQPSASLDAPLTATAAEAVAYRKDNGKLHRPDLTFSEALQIFEVDLPETETPAAEVLDDLVRRAGPGLHAT